MPFTHRESLSKKRDSRIDPLFPGLGTLSLTNVLTRWGCQLANTWGNVSVVSMRSQHYKETLGDDVSLRRLFNNPGQLWTIDLKSVVPDKFGNSHLLVSVDMCTRFVTVKALPNKTAETLTAAIHETLILRYGATIELLSDEGSEFVNSVLKQVTTVYGIQHHLIKRANPRQIGVVERWNRTFSDYLTKALKDKTIIITSSPMYYFS